MNITNYVAYFHDGSIIDIQHKKDEILIFMESSEMSNDDLTEKATLSKNNNLKGILHLESPKTVFIKRELFKEKLQMLGDSGVILDFQITEEKVRFFIEWINYPPKEKIEKFSDIIIEAKKIYWENIPDLYDPFRPE